MKTIPFAIGALLLAALSRPCPLYAEFTVHEWGTLTTLSDHGGNPVRWYLPVPDAQALPSFVHPGYLLQAAALKGSGPDGLAVCRMETPVLYFYPDEEMNVIVTASLRNGRLTDWFPDALRSRSSPPAAPPVFDSGILSPAQLQWLGRLSRPSPPLLSNIPSTDDAVGRHYAAARAVPDAWIFQSGLPKPGLRIFFDAAANPPEVKPLPPYDESDRVIFYRGASDSGGPLHVSTADDRQFTLRNQGEKAIAACFAVQASPGTLAWTRVDGIQPSQWLEAQWTNTKTFHFPEAVDKKQGVNALRQAITETLVTEGLTPAEAAAMVATWQDLWFAESGTRVLAVLPEEWVNGMVPLQITPAPAKLDRVYVLRVEILTKARTETLAELITGRGDPAAEAGRLRALELGRFAQGALARANQLVVERTEARFAALQNSK